jgi:RNA polymerase sigma-70 factor, ECF subfamily
MSARDQSELISRIERRDPQAMGTLYDRYGKLTYTLILRIVGEASAAEDVLAETFVKVWNQIGSLKDSRSDDIGFWILALARNQGIEYLRSAWGESQRSNALEQPALFRASSQPPVRGRGGEPLRALGETFAGLAADEREVLEMAFFSGLSVTELSQRLGKPLADVRKSISAALAKLSGGYSTSMQSP